MRKIRNLPKSSDRAIWLSVAAAPAAAWLSMLPFIRNMALRLLLLIPISLLLLRIFLVWQKRKEILFAREQYKWLLDHLLSRLSSGSSLENALTTAPDSLASLIGSQTLLARELKQIRSRIAAGHRLNDILRQLSSILPCPEARIFFPSLAILRDSGGQITLFIRQQQRQLIDSLNTAKDVESENAQRRTEAAVLCLMPFVLSLLLSNTAVIRASSSLALTQVACLTAYILSMAALYLALTGLAPADSIKPYNRAYPAWRKFDPVSGKIGLILKRAYRYMPAHIRGRIFHQLQVEVVHEQKVDTDVLHLYFCQKARLLLFSCLPAIILALALPARPLWLLLPLITVLLQDYQYLARIREQTNFYRLEIPWLLNMINSLLQAGLSLHKSLHISTQVLSDLQGQSHIHFSTITSDIRQIQQRLSMAWPGSKILSSLADESPAPEAQAAFLLMSRFEQSGGTEILQMLQLQCSACWVEQRSALRRKMEQGSLKLLIPMTLDLLAVLLVAMLPAVLSLRVIL